LAGQISSWRHAALSAAPNWHSFFRRYLPRCGTIRRLADFALIDPEIKTMSDRIQPPTYVYDGLDPVRERKSIFAEAAEVTNSVVAYVGDAIERGRRPGMPLSILSNVTREAPLGSLLVAFLLGVVVSRRLSGR
jgi:hypothetical protein